MSPYDIDTYAVLLRTGNRHVYHNGISELSEFYLFVHVSGEFANFLSENLVLDSAGLNELPSFDRLT